MYVKGEIFYKKGSVLEVFRSLCFLFDLMEDFVGNYISIMKCLNVIGNCYNEFWNFYDVMKFYIRVYEMRKVFLVLNNYLDLLFFIG